MNLRHETARAVCHRNWSPGRSNAAVTRRPGLRRNDRGPSSGEPFRDPCPTHRFPSHHNGRQDVQLRQENGVRP